MSDYEAFCSGGERRSTLHDTCARMFMALLLTNQSNVTQTALDLMRQLHGIEASQSSVGPSCKLIAQCQAPS
jgi:hypothetical protein